MAQHEELDSIEVFSMGRELRNAAKLLATGGATTSQIFAMADLMSRCAGVMETIIRQRQELRTELRQLGRRDTGWGRPKGPLA